MSAAGAVALQSRALPTSEAGRVAHSPRTRALLEAPVGRTLARLAAPNVIATFAMAATSIAEGFYAGQLGVSALAGLALVFPFVMLTQMLSGGAMGGAISSAVARAMGAGEPTRAARLALHAVLVAAVIAGLSAALAASLGAAVFALLGATGDTFSAATEYAGVFFPGCLAVWLCHSLLSVIRGTGNMLVPALILLFVSLASIPLAGALSLGWWSLPALGMHGLPLGLLTAFASGALAATVYLVSGHAGLHWRHALAPLSGALAWDILRVGLMAAFSPLQTVATVVVMVGLVGRFGEAALAGYGLGTRLEFLMIPVIFGIGATMTVMVGTNIGAGRRRRALTVAWTGSLAAGLIVGSIGLLFALAPDLWLGLFVGDGESGVLEAGRAYLRTVGPFYMFFAVGVALYFASQGAGRVIWPVLAGVIRLAVAVGGGFAMTVWTGAGIDGVYGAVAAGMALFGVMTAGAIKATGWR